MTSSSSLVRLGSPVVVLASTQTGQDLFFDWDFGDQASLDGSANNVPDVTTWVFNWFWLQTISVQFNLYGILKRRTNKLEFNYNSWKIFFQFFWAVTDFHRLTVVGWSPLHLWVLHPLHYVFRSDRESSATYTYQRPGNWTVTVYVSNGFYSNDPITANLSEPFRVVQEIEGLTLQVQYILSFTRKVEVTVFVSGILTLCVNSTIGLHWTHL